MTLAITGRTDRRTDRQTDRQMDRETDRVRRNMRPPPREEGRIIIVQCLYKMCNQNYFCLSPTQQLVSSAHSTIEYMSSLDERHYITAK